MDAVVFWTPTGALLVLTTVWLVCLWDCLRTPAADLPRYDREEWLFVLVVANVAGALVWLLAGRPALVPALNAPAPGERSPAA